MKEKPGSAEGLRLETLIRIRWLAVAGQTLAVGTVAYILGFEFELALCLALIATSAWLNLFLRFRYRASFRLAPIAAAGLLGFDLLQLALLLFLTGGLQNPFSILLVAPVIISATTLPLANTAVLGMLAVAAASILAFFHLPLPWSDTGGLDLPLTYVAGMWVAVVSTMAFTAVYAWRVAEEARQLADALTAAELELQRAQHLSALDGLAAAAAHELGTPLATIALVSKEMMRELPKDSPLAEDARLLRSQADRCGEILRKLTRLSAESGDHLGRMPLSSVMEEVAAAHRRDGIALSVKPGAQPGEPVCRRNPGMLYGLGNLLGNAMEFASAKVVFRANWDRHRIWIEIFDDGPGFPAELMERIGEPYVSGRGRRRKAAGGLGLGLFIAKTLLERSGATLDFSNGGEGRELRGAHVRVDWPREAIEIGEAERLAAQ
jgi:two-component system sensor histidine kinase RegB